MTLEQQRIKIAEACPNIRWFELEWCWYSKDIKKWTPCINNDPLNDLNAMHEAVSTLNFSQRIKYRKQLQLELSNNIHNALVHMHECIDAKASHRAAAFLKALNLWRA